MEFECKCALGECNCFKTDSANKLLLENICDVANTLTEILVICGIHPCKAKGSIDIITFAFLHYDDIRHRIDAVPKKRICKCDIVNVLGMKCLMNRTEANLSYSIIKRAFKAFYYGTPESGIRNPELEAQLIHSQECMWVHAAKRTAQIFASYEGLFFKTQRDYERNIQCIYKDLYDRLCKRSDSMLSHDCTCTCKLEPGQTHKAEHCFPYEKNDKIPNSCKQQCIIPPEHHKVENVSAEDVIIKSLPRCKKCKCPELLCDCEVDYKNMVLSAECSQGPFKVRWFLMDENGDFGKDDPFIEEPQLDHECPIDCDQSSSICDSECECDCELCTCEDDDEYKNYLISEEGEDEEVISLGRRISVRQINPEPFYGDCRKTSLQSESVVIPVDEIIPDTKQNPMK